MKRPNYNAGDHKNKVCSFVDFLNNNEPAMDKATAVPTI